MRAQGNPLARATVTACVIALDEAQRLPACLDSVAFCDEVVVVDSGSTDGTVAIAQARGARVVDQPWLGFAAQRNVALDAATGDWVLEIDADERVTPQLRDEIVAFLGAVPAGVELGGLPLRDIFLGGPLGPSTKYPKYRHRLLLRTAYRHDESRAVHEGLTPRGPVHPFTGDLLHELAGSWEEALRDTWRYAALEAGNLPPTRSLRQQLLGVVVRPGFKLLFRLTAMGGWRDGWRGWARIGLECATDSLVWLRRPVRREGTGPVPAAEGHYGDRATRAGAPRIVAVAGRRHAADAADWLARARAAGADVALVTEAAPPSAAVRARTIAAMRPFPLVRALDAEQQLRAVDLVVPFGARARALARLLPAGLRGSDHGEEATDAASDPAATVRRIADGRARR